jgi:lipid A 4'-phosphatase
LITVQYSSYRSGNKGRGVAQVTTLRQARAAQLARPASAFVVWAAPVTALGLVALWFTLAIAFNGEPAIDLAVSRFFFQQLPCPDGWPKPVCGVFPSAFSGFWTVLREVFHYLPSLVAAVVVALLASDLNAGLRLSEPRPLYSLTALAAFLVGPGLLVNVVFKEHWGRPRPIATDLFGGDLPFVPAGQWSDACASNCSFVSGEASAVFWLTCLVPLLPAHWRGIGTALILAIAVLAAILRVAFGAHYLSDVVLGGLSTWIAFTGLAWIASSLARKTLRA